MSVSRSSLPETFERRGLSVPFTTKAIKFTRIRISVKGGYTALMPGLSGGKGVYVLPWTDLDKVVSMSLHDRALFKGISQIREFRPSEIRKIALTIQADGYDGPDMAEAARDALRQTDENLLLTNLILISEALKQVGDGVTFHPDDLINEENMVQARQAFRVYSEKVGLNVQQLMSIFEEWSQLLVNVGSPDGEHVGYLMETIGGLAQLAAEISDWCEDETPENVVLAQQVIDATEMSGRLAYEYIEKINNMAFSMSTSLANWKQTKANIAQIVMKVENILDGWPRMIEMWNSINDDFRHLQRDVVWDIVQNLPVLPAEALNKNQQAIWQGITKQQSLLEKDTGSVSDEMEDEIEGDLSQYRVEGD